MALLRGDHFEDKNSIPWSRDWARTVLPDQPSQTPQDADPEQSPEKSVNRKLADLPLGSVAARGDTD